LRQHDFQGCPLHSTSLPKVGWVPPLAVAAKRLGGVGSSGRTRSQRMLLNTKRVREHIHVRRVDREEAAHEVAWQLEQQQHTERWDYSAPATTSAHRDGASRSGRERKRPRHQGRQ
jgi:hypothetical protein